MALLQKDKSKEVRKAVIASLPVSPYTMVYILERTRDEADDVRKMAFLVLGEKAYVSDVPKDMLCPMLEKGLRDRVESVVDSATAMITSWFDTCGGEPLALLREINGRDHPEASELVLKALFRSERLDAKQVALIASTEQLGICADFEKAETSNMGVEESLFWRVICEHLSSEASSHGLLAANSGGATAQVEAAAAGDRLEAFEALMPSSVDAFAQIILRHMSDPQSCVQLVSLAASCCDFTDSSGRRSMGNIAHQILTAESSEERLIDQAFELLKKINTTDESLASACFNAMSSLLGKYDMLPLDPKKVHEAPQKLLAFTLRVLSGFLQCMNSLESPVDDSAVNWMDIEHCLVHPCMSNLDVQVRKQAYICQALLSMFEPNADRFFREFKPLYDVLISSNEPSEIREVLVKALSDAALQRGPKTVDSLICQATSVQPGEASDLPAVVDILLHFSEEWGEENGEDANVGTAAVESLVRLAALNEFRIINDENAGTTTALGDGDMLRILIKLFSLCFDKRTEDSSKARQCLMVFFQRFATMSVTCQQYLATAMLPAARTAAADDIAHNRKTTASGAIAPQVIKFACQLLQLEVFDKHGEQQPLGHEPLAELVMGEIIDCSKRKRTPKQYLSALCKVPNALPMYDAGEETRETMTRIQVIAAHASETLKDAAHRKEMAAVFRRYAPAEGSIPSLDDDEVANLLDEVRANVEAFCVGYPRPFNDDDIEDSDFEGSDEELSSLYSSRAPARTMPSRSTRTTANMNELSDDETQSPQKKQQVAPIKEEDISESEDEDQVSDYEENQENDNTVSTSNKARRRASTESVNALMDALQNQAKIS